MAKDFYDAHEFTAKWEGGISDVPEDKGGYTAYGVSTEFAKDVASTPSGLELLARLNIPTPITRQSMQCITADKAAEIFKVRFWDKLKLDEIPWLAAACIYDCAVNHGYVQATKFAQRAANVVLGYAKRVGVDGLMGPKTREALNACDPAEVCLHIIAQRTNFYQQIVAKNPSQKIFIKGWLNRVADQERWIKEHA